MKSSPPGGGGGSSGHSSSASEPMKALMPWILGWVESSTSIHSLRPAGEGGCRVKAGARCKAVASQHAVGAAHLAGLGPAAACVSAHLFCQQLQLNLLPRLTPVAVLAPGADRVEMHDLQAGRRAGGQARGGLEGISPGLRAHACTRVAAAPAAPAATAPGRFIQKHPLGSSADQRCAVLQPTWLMLFSTRPAMYACRREGGHVRSARRREQRLQPAAVHTNPPRRPRHAWACCALQGAAQHTQPPACVTATKPSPGTAAEPTHSSASPAARALAS